MAAVNLRGIAESVGVNVVLTVVEVIGLIIIVVIGAAALGEGSGDFSRNFEFKEGESVFAVILGGTALAFYAMIGFEDSVNVAEETKQPGRAFPRALFGGVAIAGVIYLLVTLTASYVVPTGQLSGSDAPLLEVVEVGPLGFSTKLFSFIALMAVANGALINMIMASRIVYGMADQGIVSRLFGRVLPERRTPLVAIAFTTLIAIVLIATGDLSSLADTTVLLLLFVFTIVNVAVLVLRRERVEHDHFQAPSVFPVLGAIVVGRADRRHRARRPRHLRAGRGCCWPSERCCGWSTASSTAPTRGRGRAPARLGGHGRTDEPRTGHIQLDRPRDERYRGGEALLRRACSAGRHDGRTRCPVAAPTRC